MEDPPKAKDVEFIVIEDSTSQTEEVAGSDSEDGVRITAEGKALTKVDDFLLKITFGNEGMAQAIKFTLLSITAALVEISSFALLELLGLWKFIGLADYNFAINHFISITLSVIWNFTINRRFTFKSANNVPIAMMKVAAFYVFFIPITMFGGQWLVNLLEPSMGFAGAETLIKVASLLLNFVGEFVWWKFVVFRGSENTNELAAQEKALK